MVGQAERLDSVRAAGESGAHACVDIGRRLGAHSVR